MQLKNEMIVICLIFFMLISITAVSAEFNNTEINTVKDNVADNVLSVNDEDILKDQDRGNFSDLNNRINTGTSTEIILENDYNYTVAYNGGAGVSITKDNVVVDGKGHTIDGNGQSRLLYITASGVTLKNINFVNGYASHGGSIYFNKEITIINCNFSNSKSTGSSSASYGGGAIYGSNVGATIQNCTFENNVASRNGGALCILQGSGQQTNLTYCKFINNHADNYYGGAIYIRNYDGAKTDVYSGCIFKDNTAAYGNDISTAVQGYGVYNLTDSIFINPTVNSIYLYTSGTFYANNNWWGNTQENFDVKPTISSQYSSYKPILNKWYYLDMTINYKFNTSDITLNNLYDSGSGEVSINDNCKLADFTFALSAVNATVPNNVTLKNGKATVEYSRLQPTGLLTATSGDISISKEFFKPRGDFNIIQELIDNATSDNVELLRDYVYDIYWDTLTDGISITKNNMVIDGKGYTIDAKGHARIFKITGNNVTLKNIRFINGYSSYAGAVYYNGQNINILNCTFENNVVENTTSSNGLGGAMYIYPSIECTIQDCTFISNSASNRGGAIFLFTQMNSNYNLNRNIFINNNALQAGGAIVTNGKGTIDISNSIFLKNNNYQVYSLSNYVSLDYNWWGNTINDYTDKPNAGPNADYNWYFLNMEINETTKRVTISLNNYYDGSVSHVSNYNLPKFTFDVSGVNATVQNKVTIDESGKASLSYVPTGETGSITVSAEDVSLTKNLNKLLGEFGNLNELISTSTSSLIELDKNYTYSMYLDDDFINGIKIAKSNVVIDGKGYTIDAKGQSRIFYVTGNKVTLKNITFINAKANYAGAVYGYGDNLYIINCTFINNTAASSSGGAVYWFPDSYSCAINSTFINNTAAYGGAILAREYQAGVRSDIINCTFINNKATSSYGGGAIYDYSQHYQAIVNVYGSVFLNNTASVGSAIYADIAHVNISNSIFQGNSNTPVYADGSYTYVDYNWWGNTYDNRTISPNVNAKAIMTKWLYLDIVPNITESAATVSINNVFDSETQSASTYSTTLLPSIKVNVTSLNGTLGSNNVTLDNTGKGRVTYVITDDASITASYGGISQTCTIQYGSFTKLQALIRNAEDDTTITLTRDYVWGMGDTITEGIIVYDKNNLVIDGNGHIVDGSGKSRGFGVNIGSRNIVFKNIIIQNCHYGGTDINKDFGGGMIWEATNAQLINCTFRNNLANGTLGGGALHIQGDNVNIINCTFVSNSHGFTVAGAVYLHGSGARIINTTFEDNSADTIQGGAGALYLVHGGAEIINCTFKHNVAKEGGAIYDYGHDNVNNLISGCTFIGNIATDVDNTLGGGAIHSDKSTIVDCVFINNHAKYGAAIFNEFNSTTVDKCVFINNSGTDIILTYSGGKISNSIFLNNSALGSYDISSIWGGVEVENNWFGNVWNNYDSMYHVTNLANLTSWLFLNATDMSFDFNAETLTMRFNIFSYNPETSEISPYDFTKLPAFNLTLTTQNVTFDKNKVGIDEEISGVAEYKGIVVAEYETVRYEVPFKFRQVSWIEVDPIFNITVGDKVELSDDIRPWEDDYQPFLREPWANGVVTYISSDTSVVTVDQKGKITGVSEGIANITIFYNGCDMHGKDRCLPCNATVLVNVSRMATHIGFIFDPPTSVYVSDSGNIYPGIYDAKNKSISGTLDYTNNNPNVLSFENKYYRGLSEGIANITISYAGTSKYLPVSYDLIINVTRRTPTITVSTDYLEMVISKIYYLGASIAPNTLGLIATSNDTSVATTDDSGEVHAIGVGVAKLTFRTEGNNNYKPSEINVIVNVTDLKSSIKVSQDVFNLNLTESMPLDASVRDSNGDLIGYNILYSSNDTDVVTVDQYGIVKGISEGVANITLTFPGQNEYGPSTRNITIIVKKVQTEIIVNETVSMFAGERINLDATLNYPQAGKLNYDYEGDNIVVDSRGYIAAISEGTATVTITATINSEKYSAPSSKTVTIHVTRKNTKINLHKEIFELKVLDEEFINATTVPEGVGILKYSSNDTSVAIADQFGNIVAKGVGMAKITITYGGNNYYLPSNAYVIVKVTTIPTEISVAGNIDVDAGESGNLGAILTPSEAGSLSYSSNDTNVVIIDEYGNYKAVGGGVAKITVEFAGTERYVRSIAFVIINVNRKNSQITVDDSVSLYVDENKTLSITNLPDDAKLTFTSNDESIVSVDVSGMITAKKIGKINITIDYAGSNEYLPFSVNVTVEVVYTPTEIIADKTYGLKIDSEGSIVAVLNHPEAGSLTYESEDVNVVRVDNNGIVEAVSVGSANIIISYAGNEKYAPCTTKVLVSVYRSEISTEIIVNDTINVYVGNQSNVGAEINPANAGNLIYSSSNSEVVVVDNQGNIRAIKVGTANITIAFHGNDRFNSSNATVKVIVSQIPTEIITAEKDIALNLTENRTIIASLNHPEAGNLIYVSSNSSIVSVDENGFVIANGIGNAIITVSFEGNENYTAADDVIINVSVGTVATRIDVDSYEISLFVDDSVNVNATLNYPEAGNLTYVSSNSSVVGVDGAGNLLAVGEGVANVTIGVDANGKYLAFNRTVKVVVSRIATEISLLNDTINLNLTDKGNVVASLNPDVAGDLVYVSSNSSVVSVDDAGNLTAVGAGNALITVSFAGNHKYVESVATVNVVVSVVATDISVDSDAISLFVDDSVNVNATLNYPEAGNLTYVSGNSSVVGVDGAGNLLAVGEGVANVTIGVDANGKYLAFNRTVKVVVSRIATEISLLNDTINLNLTDKGNVVASLNPGGAGDLVYVSSNSSVVTVGNDGELTTVGAGNAIISISFTGNNKYLPSSATVDVVVLTVDTSISVDSYEISLFVDDSVNVNATLNYPEAGNLSYISSNPNVVSVDDAGMLVAVSEGEVNITISFDAHGKYLASNRTVKVVVSRIPTKITVEKEYIELFVDDSVNVNATFSHPEAQDLIYDVQYGNIAMIDEFGNILARGEGISEIYVSYFGDNKYLASEKTVIVNVSRIPTKIELGDDAVVEIGHAETLAPVLLPSKVGSLSFNSSDFNIIEIDQNGFYFTLGFGTATITVSFAGNEKYAPSKATKKITVKGRETHIEVKNNITLTVEDKYGLDASLVYTNEHQSMGSSDLKYSSSDSSIVSVDRDGKLTAHKMGNVIITIKYDGAVSGQDIVNYPSQADVNVSVIPKASVISISTDKVKLQAGQNKTVTATLVIPDEGEIIFTSLDESIATVDANGNIKAIGKGTTSINVSFAGNKDYRPSFRLIEVIVNPIPTEIAVNDSFKVVYGNSIDLNASLSPDVGKLSFSSNDERIAVVLQNGTVIGVSEGTAVVTVWYGGNSQYDQAFEYVTIYVTLNPTSIDVTGLLELDVGDIIDLNATLNPNVGSLEYVSSDENIIRVFSNGRVIAIGEGNATITVRFAGTQQYISSNSIVNVSVTKNTKDVDIKLDVSEDSSSSVFSINLPGDATGTFTAIIDGKDPITKTLNGGSATIEVTGLSNGDHNVTIIYSGDNKYGRVIRTAAIHIFDIKLDKNTDISMLYTAGVEYKVHLTKDTQAMPGKTVKFTIGGKQYDVITDSKGFASLKINLPPKAGGYTVTAEFGDVKVSNTVTVKSIIKAKNLKVKKSAKKLKVKVSLKKVNGKYLAGKKLKLKFKGIKIKAKTNKKGVAKFTIKNSTYSKLKVGKKYKYTVTFGKDKVTKKIKIKK